MKKGADAPKAIIELEMSSTVGLSNGAAVPGPFSKGVSRIDPSKEQIAADELARHHADSHLQEIPLRFHLEDARERYLTENPKEVVGHEYEIVSHYSVLLERPDSAGGVRSEQVMVNLNRSVK